MEVSAVNCRDVAVPDEISSGRAGTGYEYPVATGTGALCNAKIWGRGATRPGVFFTMEPHRRTALEKSAPGTNEEPAGWYGDPAFPLTGGLEQICVRLDKKIDRQGRRLLRIEEQGAALMPHRPAEIIADVPLVLIPHVILQRIRQFGKDLERVAVIRTHRHFYTVSIRTRSINREFQSERARGGRRL